MAFPPSLLYPNALDTDHTLYLVFNTTESRLCEDNGPWSTSISIAPSANAIWADNGFGNIDGELFYYNSVTRNGNGQIISLDDCARQLQGTTKYNRKGVWVRSYVIAEHHNRLVDAILNLENFIGYNFDPRHPTLDWRIRNLQSINPIADDFSCPDIDFAFHIISSDNVTGIIASYDISSPDSVISSFRLDFGDGEFTTTALTGTHRYALNARIDPVVTVSNSRCQIIQTPNTRENPIAPNIVQNPTFTITVPPPPIVPDFNVIPVVPTPIDINQPPMVTPCGVSNPDNPFPSQISIVGPTIPSIITLDGSLPSTIFVDAPPTISVISDLPSTISVISDPSTSLALDFTASSLMMDWGTPPTISFAPEVMEMKALNYQLAGKPQDLSLIMPHGSKLNTNNVGLVVKEKAANSFQGMGDLPKVESEFTPVNELKLSKKEKQELTYDKEKKVKLTLDKLNEMIQSGQFPTVMLVPVTNL